MKNLWIIILLALFIAGCGKKAEEKKQPSGIDTTAMKTSPLQNPNQQFVLRYKFEKGKRYSYKMASFTEDKQTVHADTTFTDQVKQSIVYSLDISLNNVDKDSVLDLSCDINSILLDAFANGQFFSYRSGVTTDTVEKRKYAQYDAMVNNPFNVRINKYGGILEISNIDNVISKFLRLKGMTKSASLEERESLRQNIIENALKPLVTQLFREMTPNVVAKDSNWTFVQPPTPFLIFKLENTNLYKVDNLEKYNNDKVATIAAGLHTVISGDTKYEERGAVFQFKKPVTSASGKIYFNITKGLIQKSNVQTQVDIFYTMEMPTPKGKQKGTKTEVITSKNVVELL